MPRRFNRLAMAAGLMCGIAELFLMSALFTPKWIVTEFLGSVQLGLTVLCQKPLGKTQRVCVTPNLPATWWACVVFIIFGLIALTLACCLIALSAWKARTVMYGKWVSLVALMNLCIAAIIFPVGFHSPQVGGTPFKLPMNTSLGLSYVAFIFSIVFTLLAGMCLRRSQSFVGVI